MRKPSVFERARRATVSLALGNNKDGLKTIGSGFAVYGRIPGLIVTAKHVLVPGVHVLVMEPMTKHADGTLGPLRARSYAIEQISRVVHTTADLAILVTEGREFPEGRSLALMDDSGGVGVGHEVASCGWPYGEKINPQGQRALPTCTATTGIVGAILPHPRVNPEARSLYRVQMPLNPGNSGGPVFDPRTGRVVGVVSKGVVLRYPYKDENDQDAVVKVPSGLAYVVPIEALEECLDTYRQLRKGADNGQEG